ncbi:hypothetical protein LJC57_05775 [Parabacteroides sp. OttesenSCG-928-G07]|nr:hypothetical protein [Parabacteroides sp. OttesenSCG-928-G21]MDL2278083.1 hypothetical protein [Parabacteroides sp. OttesenSCG-928-G07]
MLYNIAGFDICIESEEMNSPYFSNYSPFRISEQKNENVLFTLKIRNLPEIQEKPSYEFELDGCCYSIYLNNDTCDIILSINNSDQKKYRLHAKKQWSEIEVDTTFSSPDDFFVMNNFIMMAFIYSSAYFDTVLIHASCIKQSGEGVAFMGPSGIGKSTHSQLWLKHIPGSELLNDDQPAIRLFKGKPYIFGTPWSGKTPCYKNDGVSLNTIFVMEQALQNEIIPLSSLKLFEQLLSSCSLMREDIQTFDRITRTLSVLVQQIKSFRLKSFPGKDAAELSFSCSIGR